MAPVETADFQLEPQYNFQIAKVFTKQICNSRITSQFIAIFYYVGEFGSKSCLIGKKFGYEYLEVIDAMKHFTKSYFK